ncbi:hypothetical protein ACET3Z_009383 [Daucus carota]
METRRNITTNTVGFCLLPSELIQYIIVNLVLPDIFVLRTVNKFITSVISDRDFVRDYNIRSSSATWLFVYKKRWHRDAMLHGFTDCSNRWFGILIADVLRSVVPPGEDLYFLTAAGNYFLFALNTSQQVISVNPMTKTVKKIPPSPLGRRGTSSWRRSGIKLLSGSDSFRFLFAELYEDYPTLFVYSSDTDKWRSIRAVEIDDEIPRGNIKTESDCIYLSVVNGQSESILIAVGVENFDRPVVVRPRFDGGGIERFAVGFSSGHTSDRFHVYGDGNMMIVRSDSSNGDTDRRVRMLKGVELWGMSQSGRQWELVSRVPEGLIEEIKKPYGVMMGCVMLKNGTFRAVLMSNYEGVWDIIWLCYDTEEKIWSWVPLPDCKMKNSNMAGITFSSGLTLA